MKIKKMEEAINEIMNKHSQYLFSKPYCQLLLSEQLKLDQYIKDIASPEWKPVIIKGKDTGYKVSNTGEILGKRGNILSKELTNTGYYRINGYYNTKSIHIIIHRLVAHSFIPNPNNKPFVNHINGNKLCNWVGNLEWVTHEENMEHAVTTGLLDIKGIKHPENVYTEDQIRKACKLLEDPKTRIIDVMKETGINRSILYSIRTGTSWVHISKDYNLNKPKKQENFKISRLHHACKLLNDDNNSYEKIYNLTGIPPRTQMKIVQGSKKYKYLKEKFKIKRKIRRVERSTTIPIGLR